MIDIHCHLLPGIDDGPKSIESAVKLAKQAVKNGVTHSVVTPHFHSGRWPNTYSKIKTLTHCFRNILKNSGVPLKVACASEIRIGPELKELIERNELAMLGSWNRMNVMLLELPHERILPGTDSFIYWLMDHNIIPMIAHPERNKDVIKHKESLTSVIETGCLFQVTAGSLIGQFGDKAQQRAEWLLESGLVTVLASDAHHPSRRPVNLAEGRAAAEIIVGQTTSHQLVYSNPLKIISALFD